MIPTPFGLRPFPPDRGNRPHPPATNIYYIGRRGRWGHRPAPEPASTAACNRRVFSVQIARSLKRRIPPPRRRVPLLTAAKEPKRRFFGPLRREIPSGGQTLSGPYFFSRATGPWSSGSFGLSLPLSPPGLFHAVWPTVNGGPMRHRPLPTKDRFCVGGGVLTAPVSPSPRQTSTNFSQYLVLCFSNKNKILCNIRHFPPCIWYPAVL